MQEVNYEKVKELILKYYNSKEYYEEVINNYKDKEDILYSILKIDSFKGEIKDLKIISNISYSTVFYDINDESTNKKTSNILIYQELDGKKYPLFRIEHYKSNNITVDHHKTVYTIYKNKSNRIESRIQFNTFNNGEYEDNTVVILDTIKNNNKEEYIRKQYNLCLKYNKLLMIKINDQMYIDGEDGFINRSEPIIRNIYQVLSKVGSKLESILETDIKVYEIKRK